jgi:hypothetical protein
MNAPGSCTAGILTPEKYLGVTSLTDGIFLIGSLDSGVTIYSQQIRALNLIWALDHAGRLDSASNIAVVGGGIAGLTAAKALRTIFALARHSPHPTITLFEKGSMLCPLQRGCATRWVHPHIYDWPKPGSTNPSAGLPLMNWRAGRASDVATTIIGEWQKKEASEPEVQEWRNLRYIKIHHSKNQVEWVGGKLVDHPAWSEVSGDKKQFDIIILAIGFGDEREASKHPVVSYWRNDTHGQPDLLGRQQHYLISGTGDGGLIDLLRLRIADFREDRIGHQLAPEDSDAYSKIRDLRGTCYDEPSQDGQLFDLARDLGRKFQLIDQIRKRLRTDTVATLQIRKGQRTSDAFQGKSSFANRFLVSLLFEVGGFSPRFGDLSEVGADGFDKVIVRHGTDAHEHVKHIFSEDISIQWGELVKRRENLIPPQVGLWPPGWPFEKKLSQGPGSPKRNYVPGATIAVSSAFVSALAPVFSKAGPYRATLHRVITMHNDAEAHLQQITFYCGPRADNKPEVIGRLFKVQDAAIGLAARTGKVLKTEPGGRSDDESSHLLRKDMERLNGDHWDPQRMKDDVAAVLACPLIRVSDGLNGGAATREVVAVVFADSTKADAFSGEGIVAEIVAACEEFGRYLLRVIQGDVPELISVRSLATALPEDNRAAEVFGDLVILKPSASRPPQVPIKFLNLEWQV